MKKWVLLIILISLSFCFKGNPDKIVFNAKGKFKIPSTAFEYFIDSLNSKTLNEIESIRRKGLFSKQTLNQKQLSPEYTYWLYLDFLNLYKLPDLGLQFSIVNHEVDVFFISDSLVLNYKTGLFVDQGLNQEFLSGSNIIKLPSINIKGIYLKYKNRTDQLPDLSPDFVDLKKSIKSHGRKNAFDVFMQGILWLMIFYGLFLFVLNRDKLYLYYSSYVFFISIWMLIGLQLVFRLNIPLPRFFFPTSDIYMFIGYVFYFSFFKSFIHTKIKYPNWHTFISRIQVLSLVYILFSFLVIVFANKPMLAYNINNVFGLIIFAIFMVFIAKLFKTKEKLSFILAVGTLILLIGNFVGIAFFLITQNDEMWIILNVCVVIELLIFTFGISYRYKLIDNEKYILNNKLIVQLERNAQLQTKVNRELEQKVGERTFELRQAKEEIEAQRDSIAEQKEQVQKVHQELEASINYAERIQKSMLPDEKILEACFSEYFIFFKPRDIVSGDFYWFKKVKNYVVVTAVDCTGHGVPGAFMSMVGVSFLNEIVSKSRFDSSDLILNRLRDKVKKALKQKGTIGENKDGMDMALCVINLETYEMQFSGAYNPLYIFRKEELIEFKADRQPIGVYDKEKPFTPHKFQLEKEDCLYLFSDGFIDQFGGADGKKFMTRQFKKMLQKIHKLSMKEQNNELEKTFKNWQVTYDQMDDVLVIGLKI